MLSKVYKTRVWIMLLMLVPFIGYTQPAGWDFTLNPTWATYTITTGVTFDGVDALVPGDWIGVFYEDAGELYCAGYVQWSGSENVAITAFGNDDLEPEKNGFADGELIQWKFYYQADQLEVCVKAFDQGGNEFNWAHGNLGEVFSFGPCVVCQTINYNTGWNWISFNVLPGTATVNNVLANYPATGGDILKNQTQTMLYNAGIGAWVPNLVINPDRAYLLKSSSNPGSFDVCGSYIDFSDPISINPNGWTWIAYKPIIELTPKNAFNLTTGAFTNQDIVKNQTTTILYNATLNNWIPTTAKLIPGSGYKLKYQNTVGGTLNYPAK